MYESVIKTIITDSACQFDGEVMRAVRSVGVDVDKDELIRALQYDRGQYEKGYTDGKNATMKNSGKIAINKHTGEHCVIIREWDTGQILVCESICPSAFCTHDSWDTLEIVEDE